MIGRLDLLRRITKIDLDDVTTDLVTIDQNINTAVSECRGYLTQRFDLSLYSNLQYINESNETKTDGEDPVMVDASDFECEATEGNYIMLAKWSDVGGSFVGWAVYKCIQTTTDPTALNNTDFFVLQAKDFRHQKLIDVCCDVAIFHLMSLITPNSVPVVRRVRYDGDGNKNNSECAIKWLEKVQKGTIDCEGLIVKTQDEGYDAGDRIVVIDANEELNLPFSPF